MPREYVHLELNEEISSISGHYIVLKEQRVPYKDRELLYLIGAAVIDNSCCGVGGFGFARVPGFVVEWKTKTTDEGKPVSLVEPIVDSTLQSEIKRFITAHEVVSQVLFE